MTDGEDVGGELVHIEPSQITQATTLTDDLLLMATRTAELGARVKKDHEELNLWYEFQSLEKSFRSLAGQTLTIRKEPS